jgi:hypothetical protein
MNPASTAGMLAAGREILSAHTPERRKPRVSGAFGEADEGTRTLDLLHGKRVCWRIFACK